MYEIDGCNYEVHISFEKNLVILRDVTAQQNLLDDYKNKELCLGNWTLTILIYIKHFYPKKKFLKFMLL